MTVPWNIIEGDCRSTLPTLPERHFHTCITSPPYWKLRSYIRTGDPRKPFEVGSEETPTAYVNKMVDVARGVRRVLRDDATFWLNVGDSYAQCGGSGRQGSTSQRVGRSNVAAQEKNGSQKPPVGLQAKSLCLIPFRLAIALQEDGWYVRSVIRWVKPSPMPEPVRDRPTSAVEEIFLLTKAASYFYDQEAERVSLSDVSLSMVEYAGRNGSRKDLLEKGLDATRRDASGPLATRGRGSRGEVMNAAGRNLWNWWKIANEPLRAAHYAAFPSEIPRRCISLGTSAHGCCAECGAPYRRIVTRDKATRYRPNDLTKRTREEGTGNAVGNTVAGVTTETTGWEAGCGCNAGEPIPARVLDPFCGAATTLLAAIRMGRHATGLELNPEYVRLGTRRLVDDNPLFNALLP